MFGSASRV
jgi:hypothetical protein